MHYQPILNWMRATTLQMRKTKDVAEMEDLTANLYNFEGAEDMEINFREIKEIGGNRYYGDDDIFIVNKSVDLYL